MSRIFTRSYRSISSFSVRRKAVKLHLDRSQNHPSNPYHACIVLTSIAASTRTKTPTGASLKALTESTGRLNFLSLVINAYYIL